ncbi:MAG: RNA methyltransferase [Acidobacteria bacterium]|nr:MAG: RNA methyltransferase [Acidobacteriota bacterium]
MAVSPARSFAYEILLRVERDGAYASELLNAPRMNQLSREDRALTYELVMSTLRWQSELDARIAKYSSQKISRLDVEVRIALRLGACQLAHLERIPAHAAVHESVELVKHSGKRSAAPFANAVLRKLSANAKSPVVTTSPENSSGLAAEFAHPEWIVARWIDMYGYEAARAICTADQHAPCPALRLCTPDAEEELAGAGIRLAPGALLTSARQLVSGDLAHSIPFREHRVAVQDEASQLVAALIGKCERILDCCAAPGGKTSAIAARNPGAKITAVELHEHRAQVLRQRVAATNVKVLTGNVTAMEFSEKFDRVLADVPCSGTGTLAGNPEIKWRLKAEDLQGLQDLQISILRSATAALAPGGRLIYSTCSLEAEEGERVVEQVLQGENALALVDCESVLEELKSSGELAWNDPKTLVRGPFLRTLPGIHPCDGFFAAVLRRKQD